MEEKTYIPESIRNDAKFVSENDAKLKAAKERLTTYAKEHGGSFLIHEDNCKVQIVERKLTKLNTDKISDYRKNNLAKFTRELITASNVLEIIGQKTIDAAGLGKKDCPEIYEETVSESVKVSEIPKADRRI